MIRTKIIATIGPAIDDYKKLLEICKYADIIRFNFSHDTEKHFERLKILREIEKRLNKKIVAMADLEGPKIRTGNKKPINLIASNEYDISILEIDKKEFYEILNAGDILLIDDGKLELKMKTERTFKPLNDYLLMPHKTVSIKGKDYNIKGLTEKDLKHLEKIMESDFDAIAMSFVKTREDVKELKAIAKDKIIISKIETLSAIRNIDSIIEESDGIMIARGDLALAINEEKVPTFQRKIIKKCREMEKPVIVATQMLDSMIKNPNPTRAEINDVYSTVLDGPDALMLSGETAAGLFPIDAIKTLYKTIKEAEKYAKYEETREKDKKDKIAKSAIEIAKTLKTSIIAPTKHGTTPRKIAKQRPQFQFYVVTDVKKTFNYLHFFYGISPAFFDYEPVFKKAEKIKKIFNLKKALFVFGYPPGNHNTNTIIYL